MMKLRSIFMACLFLSCAQGQVEPVDDEVPGPDLANDPINCGQTGKVCASVNSETICVEGHCRCLENQHCYWPEECREGICQAQDQNGPRCWQDGDCSAGNYCIVGRCSPRACVKEICDNHDNDCNNLIDDPSQLDIPCYTGPIGSLGIGACRAGKYHCLGGKYTTDCIGEFIPHPEVGRFSCDGKDSDCEGCIDGVGKDTLGCTRAAPPKVDFVFIVDYSGSMIDYHLAVKEVLALFVSKPELRDDPRFGYGLMVATAQDVPGFLKVLQPIGSFIDFVEAVKKIPDEANGASDEPTYDAVYKIVKGEFDTELQFRPEAMPALIVFGDERPQTMLSPPLDEKMVCEALDKRGAFLSVITEKVQYGFWDQCAEDFLFELSVYPFEMETALGSTLMLPCFKK